MLRLPHFCSHQGELRTATLLVLKRLLATQSALFDLEQACSHLVKIALRGRVETAASTERGWPPPDTKRSKTS